MQGAERRGASRLPQKHSPRITPDLRGPFCIQRCQGYLQPADCSAGLLRFFALFGTLTLELWLVACCFMHDSWLAVSHCSHPTHRMCRCFAGSNDPVHYAGCLPCGTSCCQCISASIRQKCLLLPIHACKAYRLFVSAFYCNLSPEDIDIEMCCSDSSTRQHYGKACQSKSCALSCGCLDTCIHTSAFGLIVLACDGCS